jgi:eukaryotic-like serine/threonine-protein kinase
MTEENSTAGPDPENLKKSADVEVTRTGAPGAPASGETTVDADTVGAHGEGVGEERKTIGPYRLIKILGEGGMGQVWLAEQTAPVKRMVALKLVKGGMYNKALIQRFESEQQSLAVMNHPAIAKVFDAGTTKDGQPYFVMDYVDGLSITQYCDTKKLNVRERLELFIQVCEGVQHAHQKAIIHRDLKPSNVLVVEIDRKPVPRIIDFGIAKAFSLQPPDEHTLITQMGAVIGTRGFMSPEQADPNVLDVDTRTDVYSLGVTLYVLLTGTLPFDPDQWKRKPIDEVLRQLREEDPPSPSTKLSAEDETTKDSAMKRAVEPRQLVAMLRGDLDWITLKALAKDRARRYGTPSELAADLDRYLHNRPVVARPASAGYRLRKYVQRHRVGVGVAVGAAALLVAFAVAQTVQLRRTTLERDRAARERDRANRITDFMADMFKLSDPSEARGKTVTAREILDKASNDIDTGLAKDPDLQAQMMHVMATVYVNLGLYSQAQTLFRRAFEIRRKVLGPEHPDTLVSMNGLARTLDVEGHYAEAEELFRQSLDIERRVLGPEHPDALMSMNGLANTLADEGRNAEAEKLYRQTLDVRRRVLGPENPDTLRSMANLATNLQEQGRYPEAEQLQRETLEIDRRVLGPEHRDTMAGLDNLANTLYEEGRYSESEKLHRDALDMKSRILGPEHPVTLLSMGNLASTLERKGQYPEAEKLYRQTLDIRRRVLGPEHPDTLLSMNDLGGILGKEGQFEAGEKLLRQTIEIQRGVLGPDHPDTASSTYTLACLAAQRGNLDQALSLLRQALDHGLDQAHTLGLAKDVDLDRLHGDRRFETLISYAHQRAAAAEKEE